MTSGDVLQGVTAHDRSGAPITGTIQTKTLNDVTLNGTTVNIPSGFFATSVNKDVSSLVPTTYEYEVTKESIGTATAGTDITATQITNWVDGTAPTLGQAISADDITAWTAGTAATATVIHGIMTITDGSAPYLDYVSRTIPNVTSVGSMPVMGKTDHTITPITVVSKTVVTDVTVAED